MPLEVCNLDEQFRRYHVCTEDWSTAGRTHSAGQEGNWLRSAFSRTIRPHDRTVRAGRQWTTIDREHHITADPDGRPHPLHGRPDPRTRSPLMQFRLFSARFTSTDLWKT
ncbi:unnamed protein product [Microthlaspi erraticum]|uniref:Uncharacterized protein n=1 Tax=Microthlaspi erraticum TaxID=1685480 RepID=A0A6D2KVP0_9BRAS|nr:unnamed protein product [Microthlaspi erraticum]